VLQFQNDCTFWIRRSTGRLCADLIPSNGFEWRYYAAEMSLEGITSLDALDQEAKVIDSLTIERYHSICCFALSLPRSFYISTDVTVNLGRIIVVPSSDQPEGPVEIAFLPDVDIEVESWRGAQGMAMEDGWTRYFICFG
jgi:hypothetical protein